MLLAQSYLHLEGKKGARRNGWNLSLRAMPCPSGVLKRNASKVLRTVHVHVHVSACGTAAVSDGNDHYAQRTAYTTVKEDSL